jgi:hypothetical protein
VLNYGLISQKEDPIARECRALILSFPDFRVLARSFDRFFNEHEGPKLNGNFNIRDAVCWEKADGSLVLVYHDGANWHIATRKTAFAEKNRESDIPFMELFCRTIGTDSFENFQNIVHDVLDKDFTYMFELCARENQIVKLFDEDSLFFLAARCKSNPDLWIAPDSIQGVSCMEKLKENGLRILSLKKYAFHSVEEISNSLKFLPTKDEGYVVWDYKTNIRKKIKNPAYVSFNALRFGLSPKRIYALLIENNADEYLAYFPEDKPGFEPYQAAFEKFKRDVLSTYELYKDIEDQKQFALKIKDLRIASILFQMRKGVPLVEIISRMPFDSVVNLLESYNSNLKQDNDVFITDKKGG